MGFAERILERPIELIDGVRDTLEYLSGRHELTLFTKGHPDEQTLKRSIRAWLVLRTHRGRA